MTASGTEYDTHLPLHGKRRTPPDRRADRARPSEPCRAAGTVRTFLEDFDARLSRFKSGQRVVAL